MPQDYFRSSQRSMTSNRYRILRSVLRAWFSLFVGRTRVLAAGELKSSAPAVYVVTQPASFVDALLLTAAADRQVRCLLDRKLITGSVRKFMAWGLGMIPFGGAGEGWRRAAESACNVLGNLGSVALFADLREGKQAGTTSFELTAATIAMEAESRNAFQLDVLVKPVHLCFTSAKRGPQEFMAYFDRRVPAQLYMLPGKSMEEKRGALCAALEEVRVRNVFRLQPQDVQHFLADIEEILLSDLRDDFASRANWKQKAEDFKLSGFVREWLDQLNTIDPGRLIALRELQASYRRAERDSSFRQLRIESAGSWLQSAGRRALGWIETLLGFPVALYGFFNHLLAGLILRVTGLLKKGAGTNSAPLWISRAAVTLTCYVAQALLADRLVGRAAAGYYAVSLPVAGLYLWRYAWLLEHRTRLLILYATAPRRAAQARGKRRLFVDMLNVARNEYIDALELVH